MQFFQKEMKYLGHMISEANVSVDPEKVASVKDWPIPQTVHHFIGFASFYRRFLKDFAKVAKPLHEVTQGSVRISTGNRTTINICHFSGVLHSRKLLSS